MIKILAKKLTVEFIGTFFLVFTVGVAGGVLAPLAIGGVLAAMIFAGGHISGAHYNPAVTVSMWIRGETPAREVVPYVISQIVAAGAAGFAAVACMVGNANNAAVFDTEKLLIAEVLFTFALCYVVLNVATADATAGNSFYGAAIGLVVLTGAVAVGPVSGAVFNPAVAVGLFVKGVVNASGIVLYTAANMAGAVLAAFVFLFANKGQSMAPR